MHMRVAVLTQSDFCFSSDPYFTTVLNVVFKHLNCHICVNLGKLMKFIDNRWKEISERERLQLSKTEGQVR